MSEKQIPRYTILSGNDPQKLGAAVNLLMEQNWEPLGGISCTVGTCFKPGGVIAVGVNTPAGGKVVESVGFAQAMIHYDPASITPPKEDANGGKVQ